MKSLTKQQFEKLPKYVKLNNTSMRLTRDPDVDSGLVLIYHRDAGCWDINFKADEIGDVYSISSSMPYLNNIKLQPINETIWRKDNAGALNTNTKAISYTQYKSRGPAFGWKGDN